MHHRGIVSAFALASVLISHTAVAAGDADSIERLRQQGYSVKTVTPIFGQLLMTGLPQGFEPVSFEKTRDKFYIRESVLRGESVNDWHQMVTVTGMKDLASRPDVTPKIVLDRMAEGFKRNCPFSFSMQAVSESPIGGSDASVAVISCGTSTAPAGKTSEAALIAVIKGQADFYTLQ